MKEQQIHKDLNDKKVYYNGILQVLKIHEEGVYTQNIGGRRVAPIGNLNGNVCNYVDQ